MIKKYRSKVILEAVKFTGNNASEIEAFIKNIPYDDTKSSEYEDTIIIPSNVAWAKLFVRIGDYVVKNVDGLWDVYPSYFFERDFEEVREDK